MGAGRRWLWTRFGGEVVAARVARGRVPWREEDAPSRARKMPSVTTNLTNKLQISALKSAQLSLNQLNPTRLVRSMLAQLIQLIQSIRFYFSEY